MELLEELEIKLAKCIVSLENVLNWIRKEFGPGNDELPLGVLELVDPLFLVKSEDFSDDLDNHTDDEDLCQGYPLSIQETEENVISGEEQETAGFSAGDESTKQFKCSYCAEAYASLEALSQHAVTHSRIYIPRIHLETSKTKEVEESPRIQAEIHVPKTNTPVKCFQCKICGAEIPSASMIRSHLRLKHPNLANSISNSDAIVYREPQQVMLRNQLSAATNGIHSLGQRQTTQIISHTTNTAFSGFQLNVVPSQTPLNTAFAKPQDQASKPLQSQSQSNSKMKAHLIQVIPAKHGENKIIKIIDNLTLVNPALPLFILSKDDLNNNTQQKRSPVSKPELYENEKSTKRKVIEPKIPRVRPIIKTCTMCDEEFTNELTYRKHMSEKHEGTLPIHKCNKCSKEFKSLSLLEKHMTIPHETSSHRPSYLCSFCGKSYSRASLKIHIKRVHRSVSLQKFKCRFCPKSFDFQKDIDRHESRHLGKFKKLCPHCGVPKTCLQSHIEYVHEGKRFKCKFCEAIIHQRGQIRPHLLLKHLDKVDYISTSDAVNVIYVKPRSMDQVPNKQVEAKPKRPRVKSVGRKKMTGSFTCSICCVNFHSRDTHKVHQIMHERDPEYRHKPRRPVEELPYNSTYGSASVGLPAVETGNAATSTPSES